MTRRLDLDRLLADHFAGVAPDAPPDGLVDIVQANLRSVRQRPRWLALARVPTMRVDHAVAVGSRVARAATLAAAATVLLGLVIAGALAGARWLVPAILTPTSTNGLIAFDAGFDIFVANPDGTGRRALTSDANADTDPTFSPDGLRLAFWSRPGRVGASFLVVMRADGSGRTEIQPAGTVTLSGSTGGHANIAWDPRGTRIAVLGSVGGGGTIVLADLITQKLTPLDLGSRDVYGFAWSPDGSELAFTANLGADTGAWVVRPDGSGLRTIGRATSTEASYTSVAWSPDGRQVAFTRSDDGGATRDLVVVDVSSGAETKVATGGNFFWPRFSPDGRWIAFGSEGGFIRVVRTDGTGLRRLDTPPTGTEDLTWSPDSTEILAFSSDLATLYVIPIADGRVISIPSQGNVGAPSWQRRSAQP